MAKKILLIILFLSLCTLNAQKSYDYLVQYLPSVESVGNFTRSEIIVDDPCPECLPIVTALYHTDAKGDIGEDNTDLGQSISISLTDCKGADEYLKSMLEYNSEFQTFLLVKEKYPGWKEINENDFGIQQCTYTFAINDRFLIQISGEPGDLVEEIEMLINNFDLGKLQKLN